MPFAAKLVWNTSNWEHPTGLAKNGVHVIGYSFGLEEWLNNSALRATKIGYLDCYRSCRFNDVANIALLTFEPHDKVIYHVGNMIGVTQLTNGEINNIRLMLQAVGYQGQVNSHFARIENIENPRGSIVYNSNNWNSNNIISENPRGFIVNVSYDSLNLFDRHDWMCKYP